ncbi:hypothetical protein [Pedobacter paludis]|uniref:hypothetical protein n=1 Tax=Pedobacter paludis TaxID=2203212 RepID=UPI0011B1D530|nr:hypothetical protein [Pedobacter paludis]
MKNFIFLLVFTMLAAGVMLSGIAMKNSSQNGIIMLLLYGIAMLYLRRKANARRRNRYPFP